MFITALCPTFRRPKILASSLALWLAQDYPREQRHLLILDDARTYDDQQGDGWSLVSAPDRFDSMPKKYERLLELAPHQTEAFLVWDDDEIYLPGYVSSHARTLAEHEFSRPVHLMAHYADKIGEHVGSLHSSIGFCKTLLDRIGGCWPDTRQGTYDQRFMHGLAAQANSIGEPWTEFEQSQYVLGFSGIDTPHASGAITGWDDVEWYEKNEHRFAQVPFVGKLEPKLDARTLWVLAQRGGLAEIGVACPGA